MSIRRLFVPLCLVGGCEDDPGDLDRDVVSDLSRDHGDALGTSRSGTYDVIIRSEMCTCPDFQTGDLEGSSPCALLELTGGAVGGLVDVVETDGLLLMRVQGFSLTGPIDDDGGFVAGAVLDLTSPLGEGAEIVRADGNFEPRQATWAFAATLRRRLVGNLLEDSVDCTERFTLEGSRP